MKTRSLTEKEYKDVKYIVNKILGVIIISMAERNIEQNIIYNIIALSLEEIIIQLAANMHYSLINKNYIYNFIKSKIDHVLNEIQKDEFYASLCIEDQ